MTRTRSSWPARMRAALKRAVAMVRFALVLEVISCLSKAGWTRGSYCTERSGKRYRVVSGQKDIRLDTPVLHVLLDLFDIVKVWNWRHVVHGDLCWICEDPLVKSCYLLY
jgi:hypothetical protein